MSMLFVVEPNKTGAEHASFNAAMLGTLGPAARQRGAGLLLLCDRSHRECLLTQLAPAECPPWREIPVLSGLRRHFVRKLGVELFVLLRVLLEARRRGADVLLLSVFPNALACVLLLGRLFRRVRLHVILHGELEALVIPEKQALHREGFWVMLAILKLFDGSWPTVYVLGQGLKRRLLERFPAHPRLARLRVIEHPYLFAGEPPAPPRHGPAFRVGFVGVGRKVKGIDAFFRLAEDLSDCLRTGALELTVVGGIEAGAAGPVPQGVRVLSDRPAGMEAGEFAQAIGGLDCAVFLYRHNYVFTASGAIFDVVNQGIDVLTLENHYLRDLSRDDPEGGLMFFADVRAVGLEIRRRLGAGLPRVRRRYAQIKWRHSSDAQARIAAEVLGA